MTARRFLEKHGLLDAQSINAVLLSKVIQTPFPFSILKRTALSRYGHRAECAVDYCDGLNYSRFEKQMPALAGFADKIFRSRAI